MLEAPRRLSASRDGARGLQKSVKRGPVKQYEADLANVAGLARALIALSMAISAAGDAG